MGGRHWAGRIEDPKVLSLGGGGSDGRKRGGDVTVVQGSEGHLISVPALTQRIFERV